MARHSNTGLVAWLYRIGDYAQAVKNYFLDSDDGKFELRRGDGLVVMEVDATSGQVSFPDNMPKQGSSPIIESGSNANGRWTKFADGTMICTGVAVTSVPTTNGLIAGIWYGGVVLTFPQQFSSTPVVSPNAFATARVIWSQVYSVTLSTCGVYIFNHTSETTTPTVSYTAIGRWK